MIKISDFGLSRLADSQDNTVALKQDCTVLAWYKINKPEESELNAQLLKIIFKANGAIIIFTNDQGRANFGTGSTFSAGFGC